MDLEVLIWKYVEDILFSERENFRTFYTYNINTHIYILVCIFTCSTYAGNTYSLLCNICRKYYI